MATLPPLGTPNPRLAAALKQLSAAKHGRPKAEVEKAIFARMSVADRAGPPAAAAQFARPATGSSPFGAPAPLSAAPATPIGGGSFLDDWLSKRQTAAAAAPTPSAAPAPTAQPAPAPTPVAVPAIPSPQAQSPQASERPATPVISAARSSAPIPEPQAVTGPERDSHDFSPVAPTSAPATSTDTKNISSAEIEKSEVDKIADELRRQLKDKSDDAKSPATDTPDSNQPNTATEGTISLNKKPGDGDTILIDKDGNLIQGE